MKQISSWHIHINGQVQGVGFRPFIYRLAQKFKLHGWVKNTFDGVHIEFNADEIASKKFFDEVLLHVPPLSHITSHCIKKTSSIVYEDFKIISSSNEENPVLLISPDFAMCSNCSKEIIEKTNRRYQYAFTTCTQCGPRYSIIKQLPYDRENTSMVDFKMCSRCKEEYYDPINRRHYSQTNSCPDCAVSMKLFHNKQNTIETDQTKIASKICELWNMGEIIAIKGIGGYLLTCDASNKNAVEELRKRKHRPTKPFALMFTDIDLLQSAVEINEYEKKELQNTAAPIVLLRLKENANINLALHQIAPGLSKIGVMLPYTPLYQLLLQQFSKPIVATSGNISNASIVCKDETALTELNAIADHILVHDREIIAPQDDSVVTYSPRSQQRIMLRRARGFAPFYNNKNLLLPQKTILSMGALLKSSFSLLNRQNIHVSQYLGDTDNYDSQENFNRSLFHFLHLFNVQTEVIVVDKHPGYFTTQSGEQLAEKWNCKLVRVQHHEAHFASVLGENNLTNEIEPVLGVIWDGTGLGEDGQIWGGEFLTWHNSKIARVEHFDYFNHIVGDKMATEPRLSAFSICNKVPEAESILQQKFTPTEWNNYQKIFAKNKLKTSSVGRMFDAVASLLGLIDKASYEGEAAMLLEEEANRYFENELNIPVDWLQNNALNNSLSTHSLIKEIVSRIIKGKEKSEIAAWFHVQLVVSIQNIASTYKCNKICFSGGGFQNGLLVDLLFKILSEKYHLYFNKDLSPNDENISFGQLIWFAIMKP